MLCMATTGEAYGTDNKVAWVFLAFLSAFERPFERWGGALADTSNQPTP